MGTLGSELGAVAERLTETPRVYVDANVPAGLVRFMRERLMWDAFFVVEHDDLRRAADLHHFRLAATMRRTLLTFDHDFLDDDRFPPHASAGVLVLSAPPGVQTERLLRRVDRALFHNHIPLLGRKVRVHTDWTGDGEPISD